MFKLVRVLSVAVCIVGLSSAALRLPGIVPSSVVSARPAESLQTKIETLRSSIDVPAVGAVMFTSSTVGEVALTGVRKLGDPTPVATNDRWHVGSITKSFTSTLAAKFVEQGKLSWSTTLGELVGVGRAKKYAGVTLTEILGHRSGLPPDPPQEVLPLLDPADALPVHRQKFLDVALATEPMSTPGTAYLYSNNGYIVVGAILEQITGKPWEQLLLDEVLTPLRLTTSGFGAPGTRAALTEPRGHLLIGEMLVPIEPGPNADNLPFIGPAGTLHMSIIDLARWGQEHLRGERGIDGLLRAQTYKLLHTPLPTPAGFTPRPTTAWDANYALGWGNPERSGVRVVTHNGSNGRWCAAIAFDPVADRGLVIVANGPNTARLAPIQNAAINWIIEKP